MGKGTIPHPYKGAFRCACRGEQCSPVQFNGSASPYGYKRLPLRTDSPGTGEVARSARRGTLAPKVTEGWLAAAILQHPATPHPLRGSSPQGEPPSTPINQRLPDAGPFGGQNDGCQPAELAHSCGSMPHWGIDRCATPQQRASAPTEWVVEEILAPEGSNGEEAKSVKKRAALLHVLAFCFFDLLFRVPRGRAPWAGPPALSEVAGTFFASFLGVQKGRSPGSSPLKISAPPQGGGKRQSPNKSCQPSPAFV